MCCQILVIQVKAKSVLVDTSPEWPGLLSRYQGYKDKSQYCALCPATLSSRSLWFFEEAQIHAHKYLKGGFEELKENALQWGKA